ncbi:MAG: NADH-quinone oxidoreductase subunit NuoG [Bradymonadaceae bacterium]
MTITIDGTEYEVDESRNLLDVCLGLGFDLPYFCWHPAMGSVGACRQCAVKQYQGEDDDEGQLVMACMTPASDGTRISIEDEEAEKMRASVIEWLMVNHPHDCPVCDEGGECHLQDMTVMSGHTYRNFRFNKRTYENQYLGPFIHHEMNRCIQCYRCVRFYDDYAGGDDLEAFGAHDHVYFGRSEEGTLENIFSGNLAEVCPTGVFTDKTLRNHYVRKWDMQTAPSVCHHCGVGCNTTPGERDGKLRRIVNRYNDEVNDYFICDRGRFGYEFVNAPARVRRPLVRNDGGRVDSVAGEAAIERIAGAIEGAEQVIGIGSPRASLESNFALRRLVGPEEFYAGTAARGHRMVRHALERMREGPAPPASIRDVRESDAVLILGEDVWTTAPRMGLALRQAARTAPEREVVEQGTPSWQDAALREAVQDDRGPFYLATPTTTKLDEEATRAMRLVPREAARLGFAVAAALDGEAPEVEELSDEAAGVADEIASALAGAEQPLVVAGVHSGVNAVVNAAANVARALRGREAPAHLALTVPECNSVGLQMMRPGALSDAVAAAGPETTAIVLENDLYRRAGPDEVDGFLEDCGDVVCLDHSEQRTVDRADVILPAGTFAESTGTLVNYEGRAQRFHRVTTPRGDVVSSWRWLREIIQAVESEGAADWRGLDAIVEEMIETLPRLEGVRYVGKPADFRINGERGPRKPHRFSGRTAMHADESVHEPLPVEDPDSPLAYSMEGTKNQPPADLLSHVRAPGWSSEQALNKLEHEIGGRLKGGPGGHRLIGPPDEPTTEYVGSPPGRLEQRENRWLVVPLYHVFGSELWSARSRAVAERVPEPYIALSATDAEQLGLQEGDRVGLTLGGRELELQIRLEEGLPDQVAGLPVGLPGLAEAAGVELPAWTAFERRSA